MLFFALASLTTTRPTRLHAEEDTKRFFILIENDFGSRSPAMHNAAFREVGLTHEYGVAEMPKDGLDDRESDVANVLHAMFHATNFGGASVTIPHKQTVIKYLDELTPAAQRIGAVNTVLPTYKDENHTRWLIGDNTDWIGVQVALEKAMERQPPQAKKRHALLVGSGGTARAAAYALVDAQFELFVHARDMDKARDIATIFGGAPLDMNELAGGGHDFAAIVSTVPGDANFRLPPCVFDAQPAVLDAAYKPPETALLTQAKAAGCPISQGATMLVEQGIAQFELWTGRSAPADVMRDAVFDGIPNLEAPGLPLNY